jgi:hypothetical protein
MTFVNVFQNNGKRAITNLGQHAMVVTEEVAVLYTVEYTSGQLKVYSPNRVVVNCVFV